MPLTMVESTPPRDALPPPPQRATPARKGARCGASAGSPRPHRPHLGHTGRGTLAARFGGRRPREGQRLTPDASHNSGRPTPPGDVSNHPRGTQPPQCMQAKGTVLGLHTHTSPPTARGWRTPTARPVGGESGEGQRLTSEAPHNGGRHPPLGDALPPPPQRATPARKGARCGAVAGSPSLHRRHPGHTGRGTPATRFRGRAAGGGTAPDTRRPSQWWKAPPPGTPFRHPHSEQRRPARAHAVGLVLGPHARRDRTWDTRVVEPWLRASEDGRPGEGQRLTPDAPQNGGRPPPPGRVPHHPRGTQPQQGMQAKGTVLGCHTHTPAPTARGWRTPTARLVGGQSGEGQRLTSDASHNGGRHPPLGTPFRHLHCEQRRPTRAHAVGPLLGPHARSDRTRDTRVAEPLLPASEDGRPGEGQRLTPDAPHNGGRHPPRGRPSATPTASHAGPQWRMLWGWCWVPTPAATHLGHTGRGTLAARSRGQAAGGGTAPDTRRPSQQWQGSPPRDGPPTTPTERSPHRACRPRGQC